MAGNPLFVFGNDVGGFDSTTRYALDGNFKGQPFVSPTAIGSPANGVDVDTPFIVASLAASPFLTLAGRTWVIDQTIDLPSNCYIDMRGASIIARCGATPIFQFVGSKANLDITHGSGAIVGTASCFLFLQGTTDQPASPSQYASQIRLNDIAISSANITTAVVMSKAVKTVYFNDVNFFTPNGVDCNGVAVEVFFNNSVIYSATGAAGTRGIKLRSTGGTSFFNQGWIFNNTLVDNFAIGHDITDIFQYTINGGYYGCIAGGAVAQIQAPINTTTTNIINIGGGVVLAGPINVLPSAGGVAYGLQIDGFTQIITAGAGFSIGNNAAQISITNGKFINGSSSPVGVSGTNNNAQIVCGNLDFDTTYTGGVILNGANGSGCNVYDITYAGTGDAVFFGRPVRASNIPIASSNLAGAQRTYNTPDLAGTYTVTTVISSLTASFAKGERGWIDVSLGCSGMNAATQRFDLAVPASVVIPSGTGWGAAFIYPSATSNLVVARIPYYVTSDTLNGTISITNGAGNSVTLQSHSRFGIERAW